MKTIIGKVTALDTRTKSFTVSAVLTGPSGRDRKRNFEVLWSRATAFMSKGKTKRRSSPEKIQLGMNVIVQLEGPRGRADVVWHEPVRGSIALTATECKNLGGTLVEDRDCPTVDYGGLHNRRCKTSGGSQCIDKAER